MEWISIKDRLPNNNQIVVIEWTDNAYYPVVAKFREDHKKQFIIPFREDRGIEDISYWMPLPPNTKP